MNPLVTCICPTKNRREWLPRAIECFQRQTYEPRELVIVADGDPIEDLVPSTRNIRLFISHGMNVGQKRNLACGLALGSIIAHWDDDDHSGRGRLQDQVDRLIRAGKAVTGYHSMKFTDGRRWWQYSWQSNASLGTSLVYQRAWWAEHPFAEVNCGQDEQFMLIAAAKKQLAAAEDLGMMYATVHLGNTSTRLVDTNDQFRELPGFEWREAA